MKSSPKDFLSLILNILQIIAVMQVAMMAILRLMSTMARNSQVEEWGGTIMTMITRSMMQKRNCLMKYHLREIVVVAMIISITLKVKKISQNTIVAVVNNRTIIG